MIKVRQLDFLAAPGRPWGGLVLMAAGLVLLGVLAASSWQLARHNHEGAALLAQRAARLSPAPARKPTEAERVRLAQLERVSGELRAPWAELLATFEEHGRADVGLLKLEPDARAGIVRVTGQARDSKALFAYLLALEADPRLTDVALTTHQTERDVPGQPLRFIIQAAWRLAGAEVRVSS